MLLIFGMEELGADVSKGAGSSSWSDAHVPDSHDGCFQRLLDCLGERKFTAVYISILRRKTVNQEQYFNKIYYLIYLYCFTLNLPQALLL